LFAAMQAGAITVNSSAGKLASMINDYAITSLKINGDIDARDFKFINDELQQLTLLDLSSANILAYTSVNSDQLLEGVYVHNANEIPYCALSGNTTLQQVTLPSTLTSIDYGAFAGCKSLKSIIFPASLTHIGEQAFNTCNALTSISIEGVINHIGNYAFARCENLTIANVTPSTTVSIGDGAFSNCKQLTTVHIGANIDSIGDYAFEGCSLLASVDISQNSKLKYIGKQAFYQSAVKSIDFTHTPQLNEIGAWAMACTQITQFSLPEHVKIIDDGVLFYNKKLTSINLPKTLNYLPDYMLAGCDKISTTSFMTQNMGFVGDYALYNQSQHSSITTPYTVYYIGKQAMAGMTGLTEIVSEPDDVPELGDDVWAGINKANVTLHVSNRSINLYQAAPQWNEFFIDVVHSRGDINSDGSVNHNDATAERKFIIDGDSQGIDASLTDVNGDGAVDVADIVSIFNIVNATVPQDAAQRNNSDDRLNGEGNTTNSNKATLKVKIKNSTDFTAFQMDIKTPSHISITSVKASDRCAGHEIYYNKNNDTYTLVAYSPVNDDIEGNEGTIFTLELTANTSFNNNDLINFTNIVFADNQENAYLLNDTQLNVIGFSSINGIEADEQNGPVNVYNLQGQALRIGVDPSNATQGLPSGIYIVGGKKVIVR